MIRLAIVGAMLAALAMPACTARVRRGQMETIEDAATGQQWDVCSLNVEFWSYPELAIHFIDRQGNGVTIAGEWRTFETRNACYD